MCQTIKFWNNIDKQVSNLNGGHFENVSSIQSIHRLEINQSIIFSWQIYVHHKFSSILNLFVKIWHTNTVTNLIETNVEQSTKKC